jgi:predicted metal-dependent phosphoesterase TrpH
LNRVLRLDLHNHTTYSLDGLMTPAELLAAAKAHGIDYLAVTDHNTVDGALQALALAERDPSLPRVIPGIEVSTEDGEVIGLFVREGVPTGLPVGEAIARIHELGGLVYLPHPYDKFRRGAISKQLRAWAAGSSDLVEVVNGRSLSRFAGDKARRLARRVGKPGGAGSDAHRPAEVGQAYVVVSGRPTRDDLVSLVAAGSVVHSLSLREYILNWVVQGMSPVTRARRRLAVALSRR